MCKKWDNARMTFVYLIYPPNSGGLCKFKRVKILTHLLQPWVGLGKKRSFIFLRLGEIMLHLYWDIIWLYTEVSTTFRGRWVMFQFWILNNKNGVSFTDLVMRLFMVLNLIQGKEYYLQYLELEDVLLLTLRDKIKKFYQQLIFLP